MIRQQIITYSSCDIFLFGTISYQTVFRWFSAWLKRSLYGCGLKMRGDISAYNFFSVSSWFFVSRKSTDLIRKRFLYILQNKIYSFSIKMRKVIFFSVFYCRCSRNTRNMFSQVKSRVLYDKNISFTARLTANALQSNFRFRHRWS